MSVADTIADTLLRTLMRVLGEPDEEGIRRETLLALDDGEWRTAPEIGSAVRRRDTEHKLRMGSVILVRTLHRLAEEGLIESSEQRVGFSDYESRRWYRLSGAGESS